MSEPKIKACPTSGAGVHAWLFHAACQLVEAGWSDDDAAAYMREHMTREPAPTHEIEDALSAARREDPTETRRWSPRDLELIQNIKKEDAWNPTRPAIPTEEALRLLFPGDPLVCVGRSSSSFLTGILSGFYAYDRYQFIVPSPMTAVWGKTKKGHRSMHSLDNTGPRQFLVVEFDWGQLDLQMKLHRHLANNCSPARLVMVVHSGSKSAHGWFDVRGLDEETQVKPFFDYAVRCGADPRLWLRSQFCRFPNGRREDGRAQPILYFDKPYLASRASSFVSNSP